MAAAESKGKSSPGQRRRFLRDRPWLEAGAGPRYSGPGVSLCRHKGWGVVMGLKKLAGSHVALSPEELFPRDPSVSFLSSFGIFFACKFLSHIMSPFTPPPKDARKS